MRSKKNTKQQQIQVVDNPPRRRRCWSRKYPWDQLKVGQGFLATGVKPASMSNMARSAGATRGTRYSISSCDEGIWVVRIE